MKKVAIVVGVVLSAAAVGAAGTELSLSFGEPVVSCPAGDVRVDYTVTSTGAASAASVTETLTQGQTTIQTSSYLVAAGNVNDGGGWTFRITQDPGEDGWSRPTGPRATWRSRRSA